MGKIGICADIHFGVPGRTDDILWSCEVMRQYCQNNSIDTMVVLGDLYHNRQVIDIDVNYKVFKFFEQTKHQYKQNWIIFPGNHDMFLRYSWKINSLYPLTEFMTVIEDICILEIDETRFWVVPFITYEKTYMKIINSIVQHKDFVPHKDNLLTHIGVRSATLNTCFLIKDWSIVSFENLPFNRIYTGHFHSQQQIGDNVWYPGSPIPFKFDEGYVSHGFYVLDLDNNKHQFIDIWEQGKKIKPNSQVPPQFMTVLKEDIDKLSHDDIKSNNIRIASTVELTNKEKNDIKGKLKQLNANSVRWLDLSSKNEEELKNSKKDKAINSDIFSDWLDLDSKNITNLDIKILKRCNQEIVYEGDELYSAEYSEE